MTSKVQPAADYGTVELKKTWKRDCVIFGEQKNKERNGKTPLRTRKYYKTLRFPFLLPVLMGQFPLGRFSKKQNKWPPFQVNPMES